MKERESTPAGFADANARVSEGFSFLLMGWLGTPSHSTQEGPLTLNPNAHPCHSTQEGPLPSIQNKNPCHQPKRDRLRRKGGTLNAKVQGFRSVVPFFFTKMLRLMAWLFPDFVPSRGPCSLHKMRFQATNPTQTKDQAHVGTVGTSCHLCQDFDRNPKPNVPIIGHRPIP